MDRFLGVGEGNSASGVLGHVRLAWRLWRDKRVPWLAKLVPLAGVAYLAFPLDLLADPILGLGQVDDLGVLVLALKAFVAVCPAALVKLHRQQLEGGSTAATQGEPDVVDASYRVVDDSATATHKDRVY